MKLFRLMTLGSVLLTGSVYAEGLGFNIGPFSMQLNLDGSYYANDYRNVLDNPICYAIRNQKRLDMISEVKEKASAREIKIVTKRVVIEPYAYGVTHDGKPVLYGNVLQDKLLKEVTVKYGDDQFDESVSWSDSKSEGFFSGLFKSDKGQIINIQKLSNLFVIEDSHFDAPKDYKGFNEEGVRVICQLPVTAR